MIGFAYDLFGLNESDKQICESIGPGIYGSVGSESHDGCVYDLVMRDIQQFSEKFLYMIYQMVEKLSYLKENELH